MKKTNR